MASNGLELDAVCIRLGDKALIDVDARVAPGETLTVMGPSGSGKSTLLAFVAGFLDPVFKASGTVLIDGEPVTALPAHERHVGLLFQDALLFPHLSVGQNLLLAIPQAVKGRDARRVHAEQRLAEFGLDGMFNRDPATLSGGQRARVALARTLLAKPRALLLDEPFSKLDTGLRDQVRTLVFSTARQQNLPVLLVTHDVSDAMAAGPDIIHVGA